MSLEFAFIEMFVRKYSRLYNKVNIKYYRQMVSEKLSSIEWKDFQANYCDL